MVLTVENGMKKNPHPGGMRLSVLHTACKTPCFIIPPGDASHTGCDNFRMPRFPPGDASRRDVNLCVLGHVPREVVMEGGPWQSGRVATFVAEAGAKIVSAKGRPWQKLVEGFFNCFHDVQSVVLPKGNLGRFRGEMVSETEEWTACRKGARDPRACFHSLLEVLNGIDTIVDTLNKKRVDSRVYADKWVPENRYAEGIAEVGKRAIPAGLWRYALLVRVKHLDFRHRYRPLHAEASSMTARIRHDCRRAWGIIHVK